jgi:hypothetical protein
MKVALVVLLFAVSAFAQEPSAVATAEAACGPREVQFDTQVSKDQAVAAPEAGKSLIYVVEVFDKVVGQISRPTLRVGVDGKWVGADKGDSYLSYVVEPGEHHLCASWQSHWKRFSQKAAFTGFTADPGHIYYFRARITEHGGSTGTSSFSLDLEPINGDEGKYLVASSVVSLSHPKQ